MAAIPTMKFIDWFAGVGGFRRGMELAGHECVGFCEADKFAANSYRVMHLCTDEEQEYLIKAGKEAPARLKQRHADRFLSQIDFEEREWFTDDIRTVRAADIPNADVWCAGFPCQDISVAGKQLGFRGKRSSLFFTVTGLIRELKEENRPKLLFLENVKNLLSVNGGFDFARILIELDEIGYDAEWALINSADVVAQNRERIFIIGHLRGAGTRKVFPIERGNREIDVIQEQQTNTITARYGQSTSFGSYIIESEQQKSTVKQVGNIVNTGNWGNPQRGRVYDPEGHSPTLSCCGGGGIEPKIIVEGNVNPSGNDMNGQVYNSDGISPTLTTNKEGLHDIVPTLTSNSCECNNVLYENYSIRKLTPLECWRLQTWEDRYFYLAQAVNSDSQLYKQAGNGVTVEAIRRIAERF